MPYGTTGAVSPVRDESLVEARFGELMPDLMALVRRLDDDFYNSDACQVATDLVDMGRLAVADFRIHHPEVSRAATDALAWCYTYDYR